MQEAAPMPALWPWRERPVPWVPIIVVLGLLLRAYSYLINPSIWHDEAALILNVLDKGFLELLGPLRFSEAAPPLFLWLERSVALCLGDSPFALRLLPLMASCAALLLMVRVARMSLPAAAVPWALFLFAFSDKLLWHCCEAKPYAVDVLVAEVFLFVYLRSRNWELNRRLSVFALGCPFLIFLSYPGCFLCGGLLVALLPEVWRRRSARAWAAYVLLGLAVLVAFALLLAGPIRAQRDATILSAWVGSFPDWTRPWSVPVWTFLATLELHRYCADPAGPILAGLSVFGVWSFWRRGEGRLLALLAVPIALAWVASCVRAYPYGGARVLVYGAPALFLFMAAGIPATLDWLTERTWLGTLAVILILLSTPGRVVQHLVVPAPRADCAGASAYVLSNREESDAIVTNHWEYLYYFRHLAGGPAFADGPILFTPANRLWMVVTDAREGERMRISESWAPPHWELLHFRHFARTTVFLFQAPTPSVPHAAR
jgi:hypothetical protein